MPATVLFSLTIINEKKKNYKFILLRTRFWLYLNLCGSMFRLTNFSQIREYKHIFKYFLQSDKFLTFKARNGDKTKIFEAIFVKVARSESIALHSMPKAQEAIVSIVNWPHNSLICQNKIKHFYTVIGLKIKNFGINYYSDLCCAYSLSNIQTSSNKVSC